MSKYLNAFQQTQEKEKEHFELLGNSLLVEVLTDDSFKTESGLIIATGSQRQVNGLVKDKPTFVRVLMVGIGTLNAETGNYEQYDVEPGDICLVPNDSVRRFTVFGNLVTAGETPLGLVLSDNIQMRFKGQSGFDSFFASLNSAMKTQSVSNG